MHVAAVRPVGMSAYLALHLVHVLIGVIALPPAMAMTLLKVLVDATDLN